MCSSGENTVKTTFCLLVLLLLLWKKTHREPSAKHPSRVHPDPLLNLSRDKQVKAACPVYVIVSAEVENMKPHLCLSGRCVQQLGSSRLFFPPSLQLILGSMLKDLLDRSGPNAACGATWSLSAGFSF